MPAVNEASRLAAELIQETYSDQPSLAHYDERKSLWNRLNSSQDGIYPVAYVKALEEVASAGDHDVRHRTWTNHHQCWHDCRKCKALAALKEAKP